MVSNWKKYVMIPIMGLMSFLPSKTSGQNNSKTLEKTVMTTEINGPTSWDVVGNVFSQPNVHLQLGRNKLDWYGSGDVNNDEVIDSKDLTAMNNGVKNDRSDVDGDGKPSTSNDKKILQDYLNGARSYLPGHWDELKTEGEKRSWKNKLFAIDDIVSYFYNPDGSLKNSSEGHPVCRNYNKQREIDFYGISNIDEFIQEQKDRGEITYHKENNARFNIPLQYFSTKNTSGEDHSVSGILVGDDPLNFDDWDFTASDYRGFRDTYPGEFAMDENGYADMSKSAYVEDYYDHERYFTFSDNMLRFDLNNGEATVETSSYKLLKYNPNIIKVDVENIGDVSLNYTSTLSTSPDVTGTPDINVSNTSLTPTFESYVPLGPNDQNHKVYLSREFVDSPHYDENSTYPDIEYSFDRTWKGSAYSGGVTKRDALVQKITVSDTENPHGVVPGTVNLTKEQVDQNGGLSTKITGKVTNVGDNSGLDVDVSVRYELVSEDSDKQVYNAYHTLEDKFGNDTTYAPQKVNVYKAKVNVGQLEDILVNAKEGQDLTPGALEAQGYDAEPEVTTANTTSGYVLNYTDAEKSNSSTYPWADKDITRTYIATLNNGEAADTMKYKVKVRDLERPVIGDLEAVTIGKDDTLSVEKLGRPELSDNVAVDDTTFKVNYELVSSDDSKEVYHAIGYVKDVFGNDTTYNYQTITRDLTVGVEDAGDVPLKYELYQNYPNPFNPTTKIKYSTDKFGDVRFDVYDIQGKKLESRIKRNVRGEGEFEIDMSKYSSGTYFIRMQQKGKAPVTKKMLLLK